MGFIKSNGIFIFIGFIVVVLSAIGYLAYQRLQTVQTTQEQQTPTGNNGELTFSLDPTPTPEVTSEPTGTVKTTTPTVPVLPETGTEEEVNDPLVAVAQTPTPSAPTTTIAPTSTTSLTTTPAVGGPSGSGGEEIALGPTSTPTRTLTPTRTPTRTPTPAAAEGSSAVLTPFPTTAENPDIEAPNVPEAGGFEPTLIALVGGSGIVGLAFLLRRTTI